MGNPFLEVRSISKSFGSKLALDQLSFNVEEGELFGLLGPNGAGKTTLMSILATLLTPTTGEARLRGESIKANRKDIRRQIGLVPQESALYGELTAWENLRFFGALYGVAGRLLEERIEHSLNALGLSDQAHRKVDTFSGGMKRRLNLAAAMIHDPKLILLDEPTVGVDPQSRSRLMREIREINRRGVTFIYTSHHLEEAQALCDRVGIIDHGKLIVCDDMRAIVQSIDGVLRFLLPKNSEAVIEKMRLLPGVGKVEHDEDAVTVHCRNVKATLAQIMTLLTEYDVDLGRLELQEPSLERVFLQLTGQALRD